VIESFVRNERAHMNTTTVAENMPVASPPPASLDDEGFYEIIDGRRVELPPMSAYAARIAFEIAHRIAIFAEANDLGVAAVETLFHLALPVDRNRRPDAAFVSYERWAKGRPMVWRDNAWDVVPDLAVEVISPTDLAEELTDKLDEYFQAGVRLVWAIYPRARLLYVYESRTSVRVLTDADEADAAAVLKGFHFPVGSFLPPAAGF
jgi:Uma2 family endonuclease